MGSLIRMGALIGIWTLIGIGALINKNTFEGVGYSEGGAYWKEGAKSNQYGNMPRAITVLAGHALISGWREFVSFVKYFPYFFDECLIISLN